MAPSEPPKTAHEMLLALMEHHVQGNSQAALVTLLLRLTVEVEALREALSSPETPETVREAYLRAYERTAELSYNGAGPSGGLEKVLCRYLPWKASKDRFAPEMAMMQRLGATPEQQQALREKMEEVEMYT